MKERLKISKQIKKILSVYEEDKYIIGDIDKNSYVQFVPCLIGYHLNNQGNICKFYIEDIDLRKNIICPKCGKNLLNELMGIEDLKKLNEEKKND